MREGLILALLLLIGPDLGGQTTNIDELLTTEMEARHIPGAVITVVSNDQIVLSKSYGFADVEPGARTWLRLQGRELDQQRPQHGQPAIGSAMATGRGACCGTLIPDP
jgi:hypothetical protein